MSSARGSCASITDIERISLEHKQAAAASKAEAPAHLANCVGAGCWDTQGNRYNSGASPAHIRQDGRVYHDTGGGQIICN